MNPQPELWLPAVPPPRWTVPAMSRWTENWLLRIGWIGLVIVTGISVGGQLSVWWAMPPYLLLTWLVVRRVALHGPAPSSRKSLPNSLRNGSFALGAMAFFHGASQNNPMETLLLAAMAFGLLRLFFHATRPWSRARDYEVSVGGSGEVRSETESDVIDGGGGDFGGGGASGEWGEDGAWGPDMADGGDGGDGGGDGGGGD